MHGTHCKHCSLIPPLVSKNNLALLRCGYMCAGTLVNISRHLGKMSNNNNKRCQLWIRCMLCHVCLYRVLLWIFEFMIIILYLLISCLSTCILLHLSPALILSYYKYSLIDINCCILAPHAYAHNTIFNACLWFRFIDTCVLISARHLAFASPLAGEFDSSDPHVQVLKLEACGFS